MPTHRHPSPADERAAREARRLRAAEFLAQVRSQAEVARQAGVSRQAVSRWHARLKQGGVQARPTGPDPKLSAASLARVEQALLEGATANGSAPTCGPLERVAVAITQLTGVRHHPGHVCRSCGSVWAGCCRPTGCAPLRSLPRRSQQREQQDRHSQQNRPNHARSAGS
jgi:transposase